MTKDNHTFCMNCDAQTSGPFCSQCGQRNLGNRLNLKSVIEISVEPVFEWDFKLWRTIKQLTLNPGRVALEYISGKRAKYVNPIKYCIAALALGLAFSVVTGEIAEIQRNSSEMLGDYATTGTETPVGVRAQKFIFANANLINFLSLPFLAFLMAGLYKAANRTYAEIACFVFFVFGHISLLGLLLTGINVYLYYASILPSQLLTLGLLTYGSSVFFSVGVFRALMNTLVVWLVQLFLTTLLSNILFFSYYHLSA